MFHVSGIDNALTGEVVFCEPTEGTMTLLDRLPIISNDLKNTKGVRDELGSDRRQLEAVQG